MKLKHLAGDNLSELEQRLDSFGALVKSIVGVNFNGRNWFVHYIEDESFKAEEKVEIKKSTGGRNVTKSKTV